jgi:hypothetical protein
MEVNIIISNGQRDHVIILLIQQHQSIHLNGNNGLQHEHRHIFQVILLSLIFNSNTSLHSACCYARVEVMTIFFALLPCRSCDDNDHDRSHASEQMTDGEAGGDNVPHQYGRRGSSGRQEEV